MPEAPTSPLRWQLAPLAFAGFVLSHAHAGLAPLGMAVLLAGFGFAALRGEIDFARAPDGVDAALGVFSVAWLACSLAALDVMRAFELSVPTAVAVFAVATLRRVGDPDRCVEVILFALALLAAWLASAALLGVQGGAATPGAIVAAIDSPWLVVPNDLAWAACLWPLWRSRLWRFGIPGRVLSAMLLAALVLGSWVLQSRLGILLLGMGVFLDAVGALRARTRRASIVSGLLGLGVGGLLLFDKGIDSVLARMQLWQAAWNIFLAQPWSGVGPHGFVLVYRAHLPAGALVDPRVTPWPHNLPLELLAEGGCLMLLASGLLLFSGWQALGDARRISIIAPAVLLCLLEASTLRLWFWVLLVLFLLPPAVPSTNKHH